MSDTELTGVLADVASLSARDAYNRYEIISEARDGNSRLLRKIRRLQRRYGPDCPEYLEQIKQTVLGWNRLLDSRVIQHSQTAETFLVTPEEYHAIQAEYEEALQIPEISARERVFGPLWD